MFKEEADRINELMKNNAELKAASLKYQQELELQRTEMNQFKELMKTTTLKYLQEIESQKIEFKESTLKYQLENNSYRTEIEQLRALVKRMEEMLALAKLARFGSKREKIAPGQLSFFDELEWELELKEITEIIDVVSHKREVVKSRNLVNDDHQLPIEIVNHDVDNKNCPTCDSKMIQIGYDVRKELCVKPAQIYVKEHRYFKYACKNCENNDIQTPIVVAPRESVPFPHSMASSSLVSQIIVDKYAKAIPLYRQEQFYAHNDIHISRQDMANYMQKASQLLEPLYNHFKTVLLSSDIIHSDETTLQVIHSSGKTSTSKSYMWIYTSSRSDPLIYLYEYCKTRSSDHPKEFLKDFKGYLITDGYQGYNKIVEENKITQVCCFAHARRKFYDSSKVASDKKGSSYKLAMTGLSYIDMLFKFEHEYENNQFSYEQIYEARLRDQKPILNMFNEWLLKYENLVTPQSSLGKAIQYALRYWEELIHYLLDGRLELTNNRAERAVKPFTLGRKNWLFANAENGASASAIIYTIVQTALYNNIRVYQYIDYVLSTIIDLPTSRLDELVPWSSKLPEYLKMPSK